MKGNLSIIAMLLLAPLLFAETQPYSTSWSIGPAANINTQLSVFPSTSISGIRPVMCTNEAVTISSSVAGSVWYPTSFDGATASNAVSANQVTDLNYDTPGGSPNRPIAWASGAQFTSIISHVSGAGTNDFFTNRAEWDSFWPGIGLPAQEESERMHYIDAFGTPYSLNGHTYAPANAGIYCTGTANLVSTTHPSYNAPLGGLNSPLPPHSITLPSSPGTITFRTDAAVSGCAASIFAFVNDPRVDSGYVFDTPSFNNNFEGNPVSVQVQNPVACLPISSPFDNFPASASPSQVISFGFTLRNTMSVPIGVTSIALSAGSPFSNFVLLSPLPNNIAPNTDSPLLNAQVTAPASPGTYELRLNVGYSTSQPDCTGSPVSCSAPILAIGNVTISPAAADSCTLSPASISVPAGTPVPFTATCLSGGNSATCPNFSWTTNITQGAMNPTFTPSAPNPQSTLNTPPTAPASSGFVRATCTGSCPIPFSCQSSPVIISAVPQPARSCTLDPLGVPLDAGEIQEFTATCYNETTGSGTVVSCPNMHWTTNLTQGSMNPVNTPGTLHPQSTFSTPATAPSSRGFVNSSCILPCGGVPQFSCRSTVMVTGNAPNGTGMACEIRPGSSMVELGANQTLNVSCTNDGSPTPCFPNTLWSDFPRTPPGDVEITPSNGLIVNATGVTPGNVIIYARDPSMDPAYQCSANMSVILVVNPLQPDYVGSISFDNPAPAVGSHVLVSIATRNAGQGTGVGSYTNYSIGGSPQMPIYVPGLGLGGNQTDTFDYLCTTEGAHLFEAWVDANNNINEASEANNYASGQIVCYSAQELACYDYI